MADGPVRVLQVYKLYPPTVGGMERVVQSLAEGLRGRAQVDILACQPRGRGVREKVHGIDVERVGSVGTFFRTPLAPGFPRRLRRRSRDYDVLHFHHPSPWTMFAHLLAGSRRDRIVLTYHSDIVRQRFLGWLFRPLLRAFLRRAQIVLVTSPGLLATSRDLAPVRDRCRVVPLGVDVEEFLAVPPEKVDAGDLPPGRVVLCVGRLNYYKGVRYLVEAMAHVDGVLLIAGDGEERPKLEELARRLGVADRVRFLGRVSEGMKRWCYERCDVFVLPSVAPSEAFGIVQLEAMAHGKPVVNTDLPGGVPFVSVHGETGLTVPPRDPRALGQAIQSLLDDPARARALGAAASRRVRAEFSLSRFLDENLRAYADAVQPAGTAAKAVSATHAEG